MRCRQAKDRAVLPRSFEFWNLRLVGGVDVRANVKRGRDGWLDRLEEQTDGSLREENGVVIDSIYRLRQAKGKFDC